MKSITEQVDGMQRDWPKFRLTRGPAPDAVTWVGELKGIMRPFTVSIQYRLPSSPQDELDIRYWPNVRVKEPKLVPNHKDKENGPLPHVYFHPRRGHIADSILCLFDPAKGEWNHDMLIAETTVPWTRRWLFYYEIWEATGKWLGGGRHPRPIRSTRK